MWWEGVHWIHVTQHRGRRSGSDSLHGYNTVYSRSSRPTFQRRNQTTRAISQKTVVFILAAMRTWSHLWTYLKIFVFVEMYILIYRRVSRTLGFVSGVCVLHVALFLRSPGFIYMDDMTVVIHSLCNVKICSNWLMYIWWRRAPPRFILPYHATLPAPCHSHRRHTEKQLLFVFFLQSHVIVKRKMWGLCLSIGLLPYEFCGHSFPETGCSCQHV
jgi:hypothetical protein